MTNEKTSSVFYKVWGLYKCCKLNTAQALFDQAYQYWLQVDFIQQLDGIWP